MIAILGATGQLGSAFVRLLGDACLPVTRRDLDLGQPGSIEPWIAAVHPQTVINCAAYTAVDRAETEPQIATAINATAVGVLATATRAIGARFITFSTDYVFSGEEAGGYIETDATGPLNVYGASKLDGEIQALSANPSTLVIRTSWLLSGTHDSFIAKILRAVEANEAAVVDDQFGKPTIADDLARGTLSALEKHVEGVLHLTNQGVTNWYELARQATRLAGQDPDRVKPISSSQLSRAATRPAHSVLNSIRLEPLGIELLSSYERLLGDVVQQAMRSGHGGRGDTSR